MKKIYLTVLITFSFSILPYQLQAQTKLNQLELIKQFISSWKVDDGKDTTVFWKIKSHGDGIECNFKYAGNSVLWFTSKDKSTIVPLNDISDPAKASFRLEMEFKSPDMFLQRTIVNNSIFKTDTFNRIKN